MGRPRLRDLAGGQSPDTLFITPASAPHLLNRLEPISMLSAVATHTRHIGLAATQQGDQPGASARVTDLETAWDDAQDALNAADCQAWTFVDQQIDPVLRSVRAGNPDATKEQQVINDLVATLTGA